MPAGYSVTLSCAEPLACRVAMIAWCTPAVSMTVCGQRIARSTGTQVEALGERELQARFPDPHQVIVAARHLVETEECSVRGIVPSPLALALARDAAEPTRSAWSWLQSQIGVEGTASSPLIAAVNAGVYAAGAERGVDPPVIALRVPTREHLVDEPAERTLFFDRGQVIVGRLKTSDIRIHDGNIARVHCGFLRRDGVWFFRDLGSTGGCCFKGMLVDVMRVATDDVFHLCDFEIEVVAIL
jgi:hypothetical protein